MKKILLFFISSILFVGGFAQNLVRNGSFENLNLSCINYNSGFTSGWVSGWYANGNTPDLLNSCDTSSFVPKVGVPLNKYGFQNAATKNNYAGIFCVSYYPITNLPSTNNYYQEVISTKLKYKLDSNVIYSFSMKVSVANSSILFFDGLGVCITSDSIIRSPILNGVYQKTNLADISFKGLGFYSDTAAWLVFSGTFHSDGSELYLHIADLDSIKTNSDFIFDSSLLLISPLPDPVSYYYIDDVALWESEDSTYISSDIGQADTTICYGDSILLGSNQYDETYYRWKKITHGGQNIKSTAVFTNKVGWAEQWDLPIYFQREQIYDSGFVWVKPTKTTSYILETTNCIFEKTYDTVVMIVQKCGPNAGMDTAVCRNSTLVLGDLNNIGYSCQWSPTTFLSSDTAAMPTMTATQSMMYYLSISDATGVIKTDSIYVIAADCYYSVEVRDDTLICKGDTVHLGKHTYSGAQYEWTPNWLLNNNTIANPYCLADTTILYTLMLTDIVGNISYDSVLVGVTICPGLLPSAPLSQRVKVYPNPAKEQITFELLDYSKKNNELNIYNSTGMIVYNGSFNSAIKKINISKFQSGIYFYRIFDSEKQSAVGKFVIW